MMRDPEAAAKPVIAFIGTGAMGLPMSQHILRAGYSLVVFNRTKARAEPLIALGARQADSAVEAASQAAVILTALPMPETVRAVYLALAEAASPGQLYVDHSTVSIGLNAECSGLVGSKGAAFLEAPVSGGPAGAESGTLTVMVGGEKTDFERALPIFKSFGSNVRLCGPGGAGQAVKLVNQLLVGIHTAAIAEAVVLGVALGADPRTLLEMIGTSFGGSTMMTRNLPRFISRDFARATSIQLLSKDLGLIHDEARRLGVPLFLGAQAEQRFLEGVARGHADEDIAAIVTLFEESSGISVDRSHTPDS